MARGSSSATRERIRLAASELFQDGGYSGTSVREIAAKAEADPALIIRHFGSKEQLFLEVMRPGIDDEPLLDIPLEHLGRRFIQVVLDDPQDLRGMYLAMVRGSSESSIAERLRAVHERTFVEPLRGRLTGADAELRARLAAALVGGLLYSMWVVGDAGLLAVDHRHIIERYGALLQEILTPRD
jgi:AcrR family transcriptional regulator